MKSKYLYGMLFVGIIIWLCVFTFINISLYASVMEINMVILPLMLIFPIYVAYKQKKYVKKIAGVMYGLFIIFVLLVILSLPQYTYNEAKAMIEAAEGVSIEDVLKKYTDQRSLFYKGDYYLPSENVDYIFDYSKGMWREDRNE